MRKASKVLTFLTMISLMVVGVNAETVGDQHAFQVDLQCAGVSPDNDWGDDEVTYVYYAYELTSPNGIEEQQGLTQIESNSKTVNAQALLDVDGVWELAGEMQYVTLVKNGLNFEISEQGVCDSEVNSIVVDPAPICGNGIIEGAEQCDDTNNIDGDGCSAQCVTEFCGDGIIQTGEQCDGADLNGQTCQDLGYLGGDLTCNACLFDANVCSDDLPVEEIFESVDDAKVAKAQPSSRFGTGRYAVVRDKYATDRFWHEFDLSTSALSEANSAILDLYVYYTNSRATGRPIQAWYCDNTDFDEATITWNNQPSLNGCTLAGEFSPTQRVVGAYSHPSEYDENGIRKYADTHKFDLTSVVDKELGEDGKFSIVLKYENERQGRYTDAWVWYLTNNYAEADFRPHLIIN